MRCDVDLLAAREARFRLLGEGSGSSKTSDQLLATLGALIGTTVVVNNSAGDIAVTPGKLDIGETDATVAPMAQVEFRNPFVFFGADHIFLH